ncbi:hypothetical protein AG1IA_01663 [Rhizoctonia solani AG-1 IA]|uniref:Uncharacterized protein n=1 Tax=Thanatephorus cucumeris (strain AG1-IA) TaxID=983506 RepID=L8X281_THACA|nr:hypothetical protein AG1IA_01663 [Rhizoctonia solani AG-1 IA]
MPVSQTSLTPSVPFPSAENEESASTLALVPAEGAAAHPQARLSTVQISTEDGHDRDESSSVGARIGRRVSLQGWKRKDKDKDKDKSKERGREKSKERGKEKDKDKDKDKEVLEERVSTRPSSPERISRSVSPTRKNEAAYLRRVLADTNVTGPTNPLTHSHALRLTTSGSNSLLAEVQSQMPFEASQPLRSSKVTTRLRVGDAGRSHTASRWPRNQDQDQEQEAQAILHTPRLIQAPTRIHRVKIRKSWRDPDRAWWFPLDQHRQVDWVPVPNNGHEIRYCPVQIQHQ